MKINEAAKLSGLTVRALHHYDDIGLLSPATDQSGYRNYSMDDLRRLQEILFFRELDFPLDEIREILDSAGYDRLKAMKNHRELLLKKHERTEELIKLLDKLIKGEGGEPSFKEFDDKEIRQMKDQYAEEARERWGTTEAYRESKKKTDSYSDSDWARINGGAAEIFKEFAACRGMKPSDEKVQALVAKWQGFIGETYYPCTDETLAGLGLIYAEDERFTASLDAYGEGTARLMSEAIGFYCGGKMQKS